MKTKTIMMASIAAAVMLSGCGNARTTTKDMQKEETAAKTLTVPYVEGLRTIDDMKEGSALLKKFADGSVSTLNWPDQYGYAPKCSFRIARGKDCLGLVFNVTGADLRATALEDNGNSWEDSCCEFFISPDGKEYYNMEVTCIASILLAHGEGRNGRVQVNPSEIAKIQRWSSLPHEKTEIEGGEHTWSIGLLIPFSVIGLDGANLPESVGANFYKCGDLTAHPHFLSWSPISTPNPDFHRPEFFGKLILK